LHEILATCECLRRTHANYEPHKPCNPQSWRPATLGPRLSRMRSSVSVRVPCCTQVPNPLVARKCPIHSPNSEKSQQACERNQCRSANPPPAAGLAASSCFCEAPAAGDLISGDRRNFDSILRKSVVGLHDTVRYTLTRAFDHQCPDRFRKSTAHDFASRNMCSRNKPPSMTPS